MKTFVVLGMHRSATSLCAKGLKGAGVYMGDQLLGASKCNPYGHWEDIGFIAFNDHLLSLAGGSWDNPPNHSDVLKVGVQQADNIRKFVKHKEVEPFWGWKDPRTTLLIEAYMPHLTNPHFFCCFRNPAEVAKSLNKRDGKPIADGYRLAIYYNQRLLSFLAGEYVDSEVVA